MILTPNTSYVKQNPLNYYGDFNNYNSPPNNGDRRRNRWEKFSKLKDTCPICNGQHKRCRTNGSLVICGEDAQIPGWKNIGQDKAGIGYLYRPDSSQLSEYKKLPKPVPVKPSKVSHLTQGEINNLLLDMLCQQPVEDWAKADLLKRGVEPSGLLGKSFPKGVVDDKYDGLPGTYRDNQGRLRTIAPSNSYFCPIFDEDGLIVGGQLKIKGGKYIWLSAGSKGGYTQHINGETPHTLCDFNQDKRSQFFVNEGKGNKQRKNVILFSEGVLKSFIINQLSGYPCIGAVGGNFKSNFDDIDRLVAKVTNSNPDQFTFAIAADAGSGINNLVTNQYKALVKHIKENYDKKVHVIWYGQYTKKHLDFDDILATGKTKYQLISFCGFAKKNEEFEVLQEKKGFTANRRFSERYIPVNDHSWGGSYNSIFDFTENIKAGKRSILAIKSPMGTGKTEALKKMLKSLNCGIFLLGYRNSLLKQTGARIPEIYHITEVVNSLQLSSAVESTALCMDSLLRVQTTDVVGKVIVIDETPLVLEHLLDSETCKGKRYRLRKHLHELMKNCAGVVIMSDQLTDREVELIKDLTEIGDKEVLAVENTFEMPSRKVIVYDYEKHLRQAINDAITEGKRIFLPSDSQKFTEAWGRKTTEEIKSDCKTLIINSETLYQKEVQDFLEDPDGHLHLYDFVLTSPTAESGLSIDEKYFDAIFIRWTHLGLDACTQIMHRVRDTDCPIHLFAYRCRNGQKSATDLRNERIDKKYLILAEKEKLDLRYRSAIEGASDEEMEALVKFHFESNNSIHNDVRDYEESPLTEYLDELKKMRLIEQHSLRDLLVHDLKDRGYTVEEAPEIEPTKDAIDTSGQSEAIKKEKSLAILEAKTLSDDEFENLDGREIKTPQETAEIRKYDLLRSFPGVEELEGWGVDLIKYLKFDKPDSMKQLWMRQLWSNEVLDNNIRDKNAINSLIYGTSVSDWDMKHSVIADLREMDMLLRILISGRQFNSEDTVVKKIIEIANDCSYLPKQGRLGNIQYLNKILAIIGYGTECKGHKRGKNSNRRREYVVTDKLYYETGEGKEKRKTMLEALLRECLDRREEGLLEKYDDEYFKEQKKKFLDEETAEKKPALFSRESLSEEEYIEDAHAERLEPELELTLHSDTDLAEIDDIEIPLKEVGNNLEPPTDIGFKKEKAPTASLTANRQKSISVNQGIDKTLKQGKPEDKIIRTSYKNKKKNKIWRPGRVIRYLSVEGQELTGKYLGKAIGLVNIWLRDGNGVEFMINPECCI